MKIYNGDKIIPGILIGVIILTFPLWLARGKAVATPDIKFDTPVIQKLAVKQCVLPKELMRTSHMVVLNDWRDAAVRNNTRVFTGMDGKKYDINLQNTCMECHSNKTHFCDQCHNYLGVNPYCWKCHIEPKETK
jgi:hypothetical protein